MLSLGATLTLSILSIALLSSVEGLLLPDIWLVEPSLVLMPLAPEASLLNVGERFGDTEK